MNKRVLIIFAALLAGRIHGADLLTPAVGFGGVDYSKNCTDVAPDRACDSQNMVGTQLGSAVKRNGSDLWANEPISSNPVNSMYWASVDRGTEVYKALIITTWDRIYASTGGTFSRWTLLKKDLKTHNQRFSFATINNEVIMTGDALTDPIFRYNVFTGSFSALVETYSGTETLKLRAKRIAAPNNYLVVGDVLDVTDLELTGKTTYYASRMYYSLFLQPSSFTYQRYEDIRTVDGEAITGFSEKDGALEVYKPSSITEITYTVLNLDGLGGDIVVKTIVKGFGCIAPKTLVNFGYFDLFLAKDGIVSWDRGAATRLSVAEELKSISTDIKPVIERIIKYGTYASARLDYYPKKQQIYFSFEDPLALPHGRPNTTYIFDAISKQWWPQKNWLVGSVVTQDSRTDDGTLLYGDSADGYVYTADLETRADDYRKEFQIDPMDSGWQGGVPEYTTLKEGTASVKIVAAGASTSTTRQGFINAGDWKDGSAVRGRDKLSFRIYTDNVATLQYLRIDLQVGVTVQAFDQFFTSVTLSSSAVVSSEDSWSRVEIALSSFPIPSDWSDSIVQYSPFARSMSYYGIRFESSGTATIYLDDLRIVQDGDNPVAWSYLTPQYNIGSDSRKEFKEVVLTRKKMPDSRISVDIFTDFGKYSNRKDSLPRIPKEIFSCYLNGSTGIVKMNSVDFSVLQTTIVANPNVRDYMNGVADERYLYVFDKSQVKLIKLDRSSLSVVVQQVGSLGSGATNFNTVNQMCISGDFLHVTDTLNHRIKKYNTSDLSIATVYGKLGTGTTNFMSPSGIAANQSHVFVFDDGNFRIIKLTISSYGYVSEKKIDTNAFGEGVLQVDERYLYAVYNRVSENPLYQDVILEKRNTGDLSLVQREVLRPKGVTAISTYTLSGDFAILGPYVFIGFTKDLATTGTYYIQKRLRSNFALVDELISSKTQFSIIGDGKPYLGLTDTEKIKLEAADGTYVQLRYYSEDLNNSAELLKQAFAYNQKEFQE